MKGFIIPHAGNIYTQKCLDPVINKIPSNYNHLIYISTLHNNSNNIIYSNLDYLCENTFKN